MAVKDNFNVAMKELFGDDTKKQAPAQPTLEPTTPVFSTPQTEVTTITKGTVITGDLNAECNVKMMGTLNGNLKTEHEAIIHGKIVGNLTSKTALLNTCAIKGNLQVDESLNVADQSAIIGEVKCKSLIMGGKLKGNIICEEFVQLLSSAIVIGDITAGGIAMDKGAHVAGKIDIVMEEMNTEHLFDNF